MRKRGQHAGTYVIELVILVILLAVISYLFLTKSATGRKFMDDILGKTNQTAAELFRNWGDLTQDEQKELQDKSPKDAADLMLKTAQDQLQDGLTKKSVNDLEGAKVALTAAKATAEKVLQLKEISENKQNEARGIIAAAERALTELESTKLLATARDKSASGDEEGAKQLLRQCVGRMTSETGTECFVELFFKEKQLEAGGSDFERTAGDFRKSALAAVPGDNQRQVFIYYATGRIYERGATERYPDRAPSLLRKALENYEKVRESYRQVSDAWIASLRKMGGIHERLSLAFREGPQIPVNSILARKKAFETYRELYRAHGKERMELGDVKEKILQMTREGYSDNLKVFVTLAGRVRDNDIGGFLNPPEYAEFKDLESVQKDALAFVRFSDFLNDYKMPIAFRLNLVDFTNKGEIGGDSVSGIDINSPLWIYLRVTEPVTGGVLCEVSVRSLSYGAIDLQREVIGCSKDGVDYVTLRAEGTKLEGTNLREFIYMSATFDYFKDNARIHTSVPPQVSA